MMIIRWFRYLMEMFPPYLHFPVGFLSFFAPYYLAETLIGKPLSFDWMLIRGALTVPLFMLLLRAMDELKDYESDKLLFKKRPLITGMVTRTDIRILIAAITLSMIFLNIFNGMIVFCFFFALITYGYLMFVYFFYPKIAKSLMLAVISHNPSGIFTILFVFSFIFEKYGFSVLNFNFFLILLVFWLPFLSWEIARKIRKPEDETEYETYSKLFGFRQISVFLLALTSFIVILANYLIGVAGINFLFSAILCSTLFYLFKRVSRFIAEPFSVPKGFKDEAEMLISSLNIGFLVFVLLKSVGF